MTHNTARYANLKPNWFVGGWITAVHVAALASLPLISWPAVTAFLVTYAITVLGITLGFHRLFTHRSFKTSKPMEYLIAFMGTLANQGNILTWVGHHRIHHAFSDTPEDAHDANRGFWWSHMLWMFFTRPEIDDPKVIRRFTRDIANDPVLKFLGRDSVGILIQIVFGLTLWAVWGLDVALWGTVVRLVAVYHVTWLVNSACHKWGYRNYEPKKPDLATNCWWVGLLAFGEGWHNNHHAHEQCAYHGHRWWEVDVTGLLIRFLALCGLVWDVKTIPSEAATPAPRKTSAPAPSPMRTAPVGEPLKI